MLTMLVYWYRIAIHSCTLRHGVSQLIVMCLSDSAISFCLKREICRTGVNAVSKWSLFHMCQCFAFAIFSHEHSIRSMFSPYNQNIKG